MLKGMHSSLADPTKPFISKSESFMNGELKRPVLSIIMCKSSPKSLHAIDAIENPSLPKPSAYTCSAHGHQPSSFNRRTLPEI